MKCITGGVIVTRLWHSSTFTSWGSMAARLLSLVVVLPLVLNRFSVNDTNLWLLFSTVISLQLIADMGFSQTFTRAIAYAMAGAQTEEIKDLRVNPEQRTITTPNWATVSSIVSTMRPIYFKLMTGSVFLMLIFGSFAMMKPIAESSNPFDGWAAWVAIIFSTAFTVFGNGYIAFLQGTENIALLRRWEIFSALAGIISSLIVLIADGGLLLLVLSNQAWVVFAVIRNRWLCKKVSPLTVWVKQNGINRDVFRAVWPGAWRSGVGVLMSYGIIQLSGIIYAQLGNGADVASYLLSLRLIQVVSQFSQVPFYCKIPVFSRLRSKGDLSTLVLLAKQCMRRAHWTFGIGFIIVGFSGPLILKLIQSKTVFVNHDMWILMGAAFFFERLGAMHLQLYSVTNHIIWHLVNGVTGASMLIIVFLFYRQSGIIVFPVAMLVSYIFIYCTVSMFFSYRTFELRFPAFESTVAIPVLLFAISSEFMFKFFHVL